METKDEIDKKDARKRDRGVRAKSKTRRRIKKELARGWQRKRKMKDGPRGTLVDRTEQAHVLNKSSRQRDNVLAQALSVKRLGGERENNNKHLVQDLALDRHPAE